MEGLGAEVSAKIRSAIKAKLIELEAYVDDELPDYIMVMVANKRTKEQMEDDLGLFLNNNTGAFTHWLHAVLEKLQKVTLGEVAKSKKDARKKKKPTKELNNKRPKESKDGKESQRRERERKTSSSASRREDVSRSRCAKKPREEGKQEAAVIPKGIPREKKGTANPNVEALGKRQPKKTDSPAGGALESGGQDGYDPGSLLKNAVAKTKAVSKPKLVKKPSSPASKKISSPSSKKMSSSSKKSPTKKSSAKKDSSRKSKSSKKSAADIFKEDGDDNVEMNLSLEDKSDPMFANEEDKAESESGDKKKIINLKEDSEFHGAKLDDKHDLDFEIKKRGEHEKAEKANAKLSKDESRSRSRESMKKRESSSEGRRHKGKDSKRLSRSRSRSWSGSKERSGLASRVVKPIRHDSDNEYDAEKMLKKSLASKAMVPPRPIRPAGREEQGSARAISRAVAAADRSIMTSKRRADTPQRVKRPYMDSPSRGRRERSPRGRRSESPSRRFGARSRDWDARPGAARRREDRDDRKEKRKDVPRLSPDDIERYKAIKEQYALKRQAASNMERRRLNDGGKRGRREFPERRLAMDDEMEKRGRRSSLDRKLEGKRGGRREEERRPMDHKEDDDIRIIVRRDISPVSPPKRRREEGKRQEDLSRRQEHRRRREQERRVDEDDDELLEMRKKALESLMRRRSREDVVRGDRKIIIPLDDESSSDSDSSTSSKESEVSLSDVEELQAKSRELERRVRSHQGRGRSLEPGSRHRQEKKRNIREEAGSDNEKEPTFTVTLDGIDEKYFKKSGPLNTPLPLIRPSPDKTEDDAFDHGDESDQELVLHPNENFDEPEPVKEENDSKKSSQGEKEDKGEKSNQEKVSFSPKSIKPALSASEGKTLTKPVAPVTGRKRSPIRPPTDKVKPVPAKKVAAVKPSVAAVIKPLPATKAAVPDQKQKVKRTPITAPEPDPEAIKATISRTISNPTYTRNISAPIYDTGPAALQTKSGETCKYWPRCVRGDACLFYHPPIPSSAEVLLSNKYKWTAS